MTLLTKLFGASWQTTLFGYATGLVLVVQQAAQSGTVWPPDWPGRLQVISGLLFAAWGRYQKSIYVSNAPAPGPPQPVPTAVKP